MDKLIYQIKFFTFWHAGSGLSGGVHADQLVNKDANDLPLIPGKTLKGLLRDSALTIHEFEDKIVTSDFITNIFGEVPSKEDMEIENSTIEGQVYFSNAKLSGNLVESLKNEPSKRKYLYRVLASTAIDENGIAKNHSLRQLEVSIPLTLYACIEHFPENEEFRKQLEYCMSGIKRMGLNRSRGLGRCQFKIINQDT